MTLIELENKKKLAVKAIAKGIVHSTIIPVGIFVFINAISSGGYGGASAGVYILLVSIGYNFIFTNRDISKIAFNYSILALFTTICFVYLMWFLLYVV